MKSNMTKCMTLIVALGLCAAAPADTSYREVWSCQINEGKNMDDVRVANSKSVKFVNANVDKAITSHIVTNVVGGNATAGKFVYVDAFLSLEVWAATKSALENDEGQAIETELGEVADCSENSLLEAEQS